MRYQLAQISVFMTDWRPLATYNTRQKTAHIHTYRGANLDRMKEIWTKLLEILAELWIE